MDDSKPRNSNIVCVGGYSALRYWSHARAQQDATDPFGTPMQRASDSRRAVRSLSLRSQPHALTHLPEGCLSPLDVLVTNPTARVSNDSISTRVYSTTIPLNSFVQIDPHYMMSTPEFLFAQLSFSLSLTKLIQLGYELCGTYVSEGNGPVSYQAKQATSINRLKRFVQSATRFPGRARAERALRYIIENSASPRETQLAMMLTLPYALGGYGFPQPLLNHKIDLPESRKTGKRYLVCDQYWPNSKLDLEYDSDEFHANANKLAADSQRRITLESMGIKSINVSNSEITSRASFDNLATCLAKITGKRIRRNDWKVLEQRRALRKELGLPT